MEIANLEKSPAGLLRAGIIAPIDLLAKCKLVFNRSALMPSSFGENYRQRQGQLHICKNCRNV